jgi:hypothetical protein
MASMDKDSLAFCPATDNIASKIIKWLRRYFIRMGLLSSEK